MTSRASTSGPSAKRQSSAAVASAVRPQCKIHDSAVVAEKAQLIGPHLVEIGEGAIIHPYAKIRAEHGNVIIGKSSIVAEKAVVGPAEDDGEAGCMVGESVSIETGAVVEARSVGDFGTVEVNARIRSGCVLGKWCKVGALCEMDEKEVLRDYTVVFGEGQRRVDTTTKQRKEVRDVRAKGREQEVQLLKGLIVDAKAKWMD